MGLDQVDCGPCSRGAFDLIRPEESEKLEAAVIRRRIEWVRVTTCTIDDAQRGERRSHAAAPPIGDDNRAFRIAANAVAIDISERCQRKVEPAATTEFAQRKGQA